ncbi:MAG TPA: aminotransferase class I/II-fold pyridoxal phosphate-dependent enzyme [Trueperaceae bacterium]
MSEERKGRTTGRPGRNGELERDEDSFDIETLLLQDAPLPPAHGAAPALHQTSLFTFASFSEMRAAIESKRGTLYTRGRNPTVRAFEEKVALLEGAEDAVAFASGMAAIAAAVLSNVESGSKIVCVRNVYPDAHKLMTRFLPRYGVETVFVDGSDTDAVAAKLDGASLLYLENPTTLLFELQDLEALTSLAREHGAITIVDNSWATPLLQRPLDHGADLVLHSASKYLSGHSDVVAGVVAGSGERVAAIRDLELMVIGGKLSPFDAWLLLRGLRTLPIRMKRHHSSAERVAEFLRDHPAVESVNYPGDRDNPHSELFDKYFDGAGGLLSFELTDERLVEPFVDALRVFRLGVSWGGFESLVYPALMSHLTGGPYSATAAFGVPRTLVRLFVGLEDPGDLVSDLAQAISTARRTLEKGERNMEV